MSYVFVALVLLALWHWIYESLIAPSWRQSLHFELSLLRQHLARRQGSVGDREEAECVSVLAGRVDALSETLERFDVMTVAAIEMELRRNPRLRARVEARRALFERGKSEELQQLAKRIVSIARRALALNSGAWFIFIVPAAFVRLGMARLGRSVSTSLLLSRAEFHRIAGA